MIIKLAGITDLVSGLTPSGIIGVGTNLVIGSQIHDLGHFLVSKGNKLGKATQRSAIADALIAVKKAKEGKVYGNRTIAGLGLYALSPQKMLAMHETNQLVHKMPKILNHGLLRFDDKNKFNVQHLKRALGWGSKINNGITTLQVGAPVVGGIHSFRKAKNEGKTNLKSFEAGFHGALQGAGISSALIVPRIALRGAAGLHKTLSVDKNYGYKMLDEAAKSAAKSMNRPSIFNYSKHVYVTPKQNLKGKAGFVGTLTDKIMGFKKPIDVDAVNDYSYGRPQTALDKIKKKTDMIPKALGFDLQ